MSTDWKGLLGGIAPAVATALGGPAAGVAVKALSQTLFGHPDGSEEDIAAAVAGATPEQIAALKKLDQEFVLSLADKAAGLEKIDADDRASARDMQKSQHSVTPAVLSYGAFLLYAAMFCMFTFAPIPPSNSDTLKQMAEALKLIMMTVFGFWLGGSNGSEVKTAILGQIAKTK